MIIRVSAPMTGRWYCDLDVPAEALEGNFGDWLDNNPEYIEEIEEEGFAEITSVDLMDITVED